MKHVQLIVSKLGQRVFRNNTGQAWQGDVHRLRDGSVLIKNPRPVHFGLVKGSGDLIGFVKKTVTHDMLGNQILIFTNLEIKSKNGRITKEQQSFHEYISNNGGISEIIKSLSEGDQLEKTFHSFRGLKISEQDKNR